MNPESASTGTLVRELGDWNYATDSGTGELLFIRFKFKPLPAPGGISQTQYAFPARFYHGGTGTPHGVYILMKVELKRDIWVKPAFLNPADVARRCNALAEPVRKLMQEFLAGKSVIYEMRLGRGEISTANLDEIFLFVLEMPEMAAMKTLGEKLHWLGNWTLDFVGRENDEEKAKIEAAAKARNEAMLEKFPARFPYEPEGFCHYKNRQDVLWELHRREWARLFRAHENYQRAKTEDERAKFKRESWLAYIADHKALYGKEPEVRQSEKAGLVFDDGFHQMWYDAMNSKRGKVDKRDWQLANWWIEKNYYRMNEKELKENFNRDWNYSPGYKGNTLARRARDILGRGKTGLVSALKPGRPEKPNTLPPG